MKRITILTVAALAGLICLASLGVSTAWASDAVLCKNYEEKCKTENVIPKGTEIVAETEEPVEIATNTSVQITCDSTLKATVGSGSGDTRYASITDWTLGSCTGLSTEGDCGEAQAENLPYTAELTLAEDNVPLSKHPQWHLTCKLWGYLQTYFECTFTGYGGLHFSESHLGLEYSEVEFETENKSCTAEVVVVSGTFQFVSPEGPIYVAAEGDEPKAPTVTTGNADHITGGGATLHGSVNPNGALTKYWFEYGKTTAYGTKIPVTAAEIGSGWYSVGVSQTPSGLSGTYHYRLVAENVSGKGTGGDKTVYVGAPSKRSEFGSAETMSYPAGIAVDSSGNLWVADLENQIQHWTAGGELMTTWAAAEPSGVAVDSEGNLWLTDLQHGRIGGIDPEAEEAFAVFGEGELSYPEAVAVDPEGDIWVVDTGLGEVLEYDREGNLLQTINPPYGSEPTGVAVSSTGVVYVAYQSGVSYIYEYSQAGKTIRSWNMYPRYPGSLAVDGDGDVWVADEAYGQVIEYSETGQYITQFGSFEFSRPGGIAVDSANNIWVSNQVQHRVEKWSR